MGAYYYTAIMTKEFYNNSLKNKNTKISLIFEGKNEIIKIPLEDFQNHFQFIKDAVDFDISNELIGEQIIDKEFEEDVKEELSRKF